jgi:hypothetical protein
VLTNCATGFFVQRLGGQVQPARPRDRAGLRVDIYAREERRIAQWSEYPALLSSAEVDVARRPVSERQAQAMVAHNGDARDVDGCLHSSRS